MSYTHLKHEDVPKTDKFGIHIDVYPRVGESGLVIVETETGHNEEFYDTVSTFHYIVLEGEGTFYLDDEPVPVKQGDLVSVEPNTRIYYKGKMRLALTVHPAWQAEHEVETRSRIW